MVAAVPSVAALAAALGVLALSTQWAMAEPCVRLEGPATPIGLDTSGTPPMPPPPLVPETVTLSSRPVLFVSGESKWDDSEQTLGDAFRAVFGEIGRLGLKPAGKPMVEYVDSDDEKFTFKAMVPIEAKPTAGLGEAVTVGDGPAGNALKFVHQGSFDDLEQVYNRIDDYLAAKHLTMKRVVEEYQTDRLKTPPDKLITNIYIFTE